MQAQSVTEQFMLMQLRGVGLQRAFRESGLCREFNRLLGQADSVELQKDDRQLRLYRLHALDRLAGYGFGDPRLPDTATELVLWPWPDDQQAYYRSAGPYTPSGMLMQNLGLLNEVLGQAGRPATTAVCHEASSPHSGDRKILTLC